VNIKHSPLVYFTNVLNKSFAPHPDKNARTKILNAVPSGVTNDGKIVKAVTPDIIITTTAVKRYLIWNAKSSPGLDHFFRAGKIVLSNTPRNRPMTITYSIDNSMIYKTF